MTKKSSELFIAFQTEMPSNEMIIGHGLERVLAEKSKEQIKASFSALLLEAKDSIYQEYLRAEKQVGNEVLKKFLATEPGDPFGLLNEFFMSIAQSRKSRAGKAFEMIIRTMFKKCGYPFSEQPLIDGKPDFVMPSIEHYKVHPMDCLIFTAKQTIRERWRQIVTEGMKANGFFLATIDQKLTESQLTEMMANKIFVVVPSQDKQELKTYQAARNVMSFEDFFADYLDGSLAKWKKHDVQGI